MVSCNATGNLTKVKISPKNKNLVFCEDKLLIGKSDIKSDVFDILYFARRDIEEVIIPPFIRIISPYAFNFCQKLTKAEFLRRFKASNNWRKCIFLLFNNINIDTEKCHNDIFICFLQLSFNRFDFFRMFTT